MRTDRRDGLYVRRPAFANRRPDSEAGKDDDLTDRQQPLRRLWSGPLGMPERAAPALPLRRRAGLRRTVLAIVAFGFSMAVLVLVAAGVLLSMLANGIISVDLAGQIASTLNRRVGGGYAFTIGSTAIEGTAFGPSLAINGLAVRDGRGRTIIAAPRASVAVDPFSLALGEVAPKRLELEDLSLRLIRLGDGTMALSGGADEADDVRLSNLASTLSEPADAGSPADPAAAPQAPARPASLPALLAKAVASGTDALFSEGSPLRAVDRFGVQNATLTVEDRLRGATTVYRNIAIDLDREPTGSIYVTVAGDGPAGHWSWAARAYRETDGSRKVDLAADHLSPDELMLAAGLRAAKFETDMPLSFSLNAEVGPDGRLLRAGGPVSIGAGYFKLDDPDHEPVMVDRLDAVLAMDPATGALSFGNGILVADRTRFDFDLSATPPVRPDDAWAVAGKAHGVFGPERPGEKPIALDRIAFAARVLPESGRIMLDEASIGGPAVDFKMTASFEPVGTGFLVRSTMAMGRMAGADVVRLWPSFVAAPVRAWFLRNLQGGFIEGGQGTLALTDTDLDLMRQQRSPPDDHVHIEFRIADASIAFMDGVPPLRGLDAVGRITGDTFTLTASKAEMEISPGHRLSASEGSVTIASTDPKPTPGVIALKVTGAIDTLADLLARESLKSYANLPIDSSSVAGAFEGRLTVNLKFGDRVPKESTRIGVTAKARDFSVSKLIGKEGLQNATLDVTADGAGIRAKGEGSMFGAPATIDVRKPAGGGPSDASIVMALDDAARQKAGFGFGKSITGTMTAKITTSFTAGEKNRAAVSLDFTRCAFDAPIPGLKKAADRPSKATFTVLQEQTRTQLESIVFDAGSTAIRGAAVLDGNGGLVSAALSQMRLSPGDDARVDIARSGDGLKVVVRGANIDARPFLRYVTGEATAAGDGPSQSLDLDLRATLVTGQNAQAMSAVDLKLAKRGSNLRRLQMSGRLGRGPITAGTTGQGGAPVMVIAAKDAGAMLSFLDLYKRMDGGSLDSTLRFGDGGRIDGSAVIHNFTIREDPSLKRLASEDIPSGSRNAGARIDASAVGFTKLEAQFTRTGNRIDVRQGSMYGPQLGATVEGAIDFGHDKVALNGTLVPLYGLNNLFSQIPLVGLLLGGGSHEGLFALTYHITGSASAPVFAFNPLSALAPGFLRKIFGAIDDAAQQGLQDGGKTAAPSSPQPAPE